MLGLDVFFYLEDIDFLKLNLSVEKSWNYAGEGNESYSEKYLLGTDEVIAGLCLKSCSKFCIFEGFFLDIC